MTKFESSFSKLDLPLHGVRCPQIEISLEDKKKINAPPDCSNLEFLKLLCNFHFKERLPGWRKKGYDIKKYTERMRYEIGLFEELGFVDYVLLVWDTINFCRNKDIAIGRGRGSSAASLAFYVMGITGVDSIQHNLFFERFISRTRAKKTEVNGITYLDGSLMCDVDMDICCFRRHEVVEYLAEKFPNKTSKITNISTLSGKALIKDCGKIIAEKAEDEMMPISSMLTTQYGVVEDIEEAYKNNEDFQKWCNNNKLVYETAVGLKDLIRNKSVHASALVISFDNLDESCPVERVQDGSASCYTKDWVGKIQLKLDLLGLKSISVVSDACKMIGIDYNDIDFYNYEKIYSHLQDLEFPYGIFQLESHATLASCREIKPKNFDQLSAVLAICRPGASAFLGQYSKYVNQGIYEPVDPLIDDILAETGGVCLYQETVLRMFARIGFSLDEAEQIRRIIGRKKLEEIGEWKVKIYDKCKQNNIKEEVADLIWKICDDSAKYQFSSAHSTAYSIITCYTVFLKFNYPKEFFLALLKMAREEADSHIQIGQIAREMFHFKLKILKPHILKSEIDFTIEPEGIRYGLSAIKGISNTTIKKIVQFRNPYDTKLECFLAAKQSGLNIGQLSALIQSGVLEGLEDKGESRSMFCLEAQVFNILTDKEKVLVKSIFDNENEKNILKIIKSLTTRLNEKGKPLLKPSRFETIKKRYEPFKAIYESNSQNEDFANWFYERTLLGYSYSEKLCEIFRKEDPNVIPIGDIKDCGAEKIMTVGIIEEIKKTTSKAGNKYIKFTISDETGKIDALLFDGKRGRLEECQAMNGGKLPKEGNIVIVEGNKKTDECLYADAVAIQDSKIYLKYSQMKADREEEEIKE